MVCMAPRFYIVCNVCPPGVNIGPIVLAHYRIIGIPYIYLYINIYIQLPIWPFKNSIRIQMHVRA